MPSGQKAYNGQILVKIPPVDITSIAEYLKATPFDWRTVPKPREPDQRHDYGSTIN